MKLETITETATTNQWFEMALEEHRSDTFVLDPDVVCSALDSVHSMKPLPTHHPILRCELIQQKIQIQAVKGEYAVLNAVWEVFHESMIRVIGQHTQYVESLADYVFPFSDPHRLGLSLVYLQYLRWDLNITIVELSDYSRLDQKALQFHIANGVKHLTFYIVQREIALRKTLDL